MTSLNQAQAQAMAYTFSYRSDVVVTGTYDDGQSIINEKYYVVAEDEYGFRKAHLSHAFLEQPVRELCERLTAQGDTLADPERWYDIDPAYGSEAYCELQPLLVAQEKQDA